MRRRAVGLLLRFAVLLCACRGLGLVGIGSAVGVVAALLFTRLLASLLYGVSAADPPAIAGAVLALVAVGSVAAWFPARRASHTDPAVVLREQ